ncbi:MAG TPA: TonB-dependent siderophore receptor [Steroidobacteraceae bacterium]|nr:TonB-dependent siderophore receptor [Steroidobacteraceae bacterium]
MSTDPSVAPALGAEPTQSPLRSRVGSLSACGIGVTSMLGAAAACQPAAAQAVDQSAAGGASEPLQQVTVSGVRPLVKGKIAQDLQDIPQSVTVVNQQLIEAQSDTRLEDALKNVPGITLNAGEGAARGDTVNIRGFSAFNDFFLDGIRDAAVYTRDSFDLESVEVVKGPSAVLFGRGSTGGAINQVSKAPELAPFEVITADFGTNDLLRSTADVNAPFASAEAFRLNAMGESSAVADRDFVKNRRWGLAPALAFGIGGPDTLVLAYLHQQEDDRPDPGIPFLDGLPAPVPGNTYYGLLTDRDTTAEDIATARYRHEFASSLSLSNTLRYAHYEFDYRTTMPNFGSAADDGQGPPGPQIPLTDILIGRDAPYSSGIQTNLDDQLDLTAHFSTGAVTHEFVGGLEYSRQSSDLARYANPFNANNNWIPETPLLDPDPYQALPALPPTSADQDTLAYAYSAYATDTIGLTSELSLLAGARYDEFSADYDQLTLATDTPLDLHHVDRLGSPRAALEFTPAAQQTYYFFYGTSFDPSAEALTLTTKTANLGPVKAQTFELGAKDTLLGGGLLLSSAVFRTVVDNAQTNDPENPNVTLLEGNQRVDGLELTATGHVTRAWELTAGYTYLDGRTIASGTAAYVGKDLPNVAHNEINLWTEYEFSGPWEMGVGGNWFSHRFADNGEAASLPGYTVVNAMVSYRLTQQVSLQLNGFNLLNKLYYQSPYYTSVAENHVLPGPGRSGSLTIRAAL